MRERARQIVDRGLEAALVVTMGANVLNVLWQVFTRFVLGRPSSWTEELARFLLIWLALLGAAYVAGRKMHLAIGAVVERLDARTRRRVEIVAHLAVGLFAAGVMGVGGLRLVWITFALEQTSAALGIRLGYVYAVLPASGALILFYSLGHVADAAAGRSEGEA
jgi:TRAP-type C4-dicarboxylate transport system permease small subunit